MIRSCLWILLLTGPVLADDLPQLHDSRLELTLFAEQPEIVTPIGMAIDSRDRLFVIESHTHLRPRDYEGPASDRIKVFTDHDRDGRADDVRVFAEGLEAAMNLAFSPDGILYAVCAREVVALRDHDADGQCDEQRRVLRLATSERYPHNSALGITFSRDGWLYVSRGNLSSRSYSWEGSDGSRVSGYGDGGNIVRCRPDGSRLEEFATGFWNPFAMQFDFAGRLLCVDNDPDARGPNRLVHVVRGGDYGYKSLYGGGGNHPFQSWNGELPGTLPIISGTGEAPSGLLSCRRTALPADYTDSVLVTVWNENTIERHALESRGASLAGQASMLVSGGKSFRPVAIDADARGNIYITDWVLVDYPNHGRGRIWKLAARPDVRRGTPRAYFGPYEPTAAMGEMEAVLAAGPQDLPRIVAALRRDDPFLLHAAVGALARQDMSQQRRELAGDTDPRLRLAALLAARRAEQHDSQDSHRLAQAFLVDPDPLVRRAALQWIGESMMTRLRDDLERAIQTPPVPGPLLETYLAAAQNLDPDFVRDFRQQRQERARDTRRGSDEQLLRDIAADPAHTAEVRVLATRHLRRMDQPATQRLLMELTSAPDPTLRLAAIGRLAGHSGSTARRRLLAMARDEGQPSDVRAEALVSLGYFADLDPQQILPLLDDSDREVQWEAARLLRSLAQHPDVQSAARAKLAEGDVDGALREQLELYLNVPRADRPQTLPQWTRALAEGGRPQRGRRVFHAAHTTCSKCHTIGGTGGTLGPDLSNVARSLSREQIIHSILRPADQFAPQYQAWQVLTKDGRVHVGLQLDHKARGDIELFTTAGEVVHFSANEIEDYGVTRNSIMPSGLEATMTVSEFRDLLAFLETADGR